MGGAKGRSKTMADDVSVRTDQSDHFAIDDRSLSNLH